jgi:hypothetical protein
MLTDPVAVVNTPATVTRTLPVAPGVNAQVDPRPIVTRVVETVEAGSDGLNPARTGSAPVVFSSVYDGGHAPVFATFRAPW